MSYTNKLTQIRHPLYWRKNAGVVSYSGVLANTATEIRSGTKVLDWKEKIRMGLNASSAYSSTRFKLLDVEEANFAWAFKQKSSPGTVIPVSVSGVFLENPYYGMDRAHNFTPDTQFAEASALSKVYKKIESEYQRLNSPAIIAEFLDVIRQFGSPAKALVDLTNRRVNQLALASKGLKGSTTFRKIKYQEVVASTWLEYSFGLAPIISDTRSVAEALARFHLEVDDPGLVKLRRRVITRAGSEKVTNFTTQMDLSPLRGTVYNTIKTTDSYRVQYTCGLQGDLDAAYGSNDRLLQLLGFNHANWIPAIWEAVPWSWLIDYFSNVQEILSAAVTNTSRVAWICKSVTRKTETEYSTKLDLARMRFEYDSIGYAPYGPQLGRADTGKLKTLKTTFVRTVPSSLGVPPLVFEHPFGDVKKLANMVSVLLARRPGNSALWIS